MSRRPRVYVINRSAHDNSPAERFGELIYITEGRVEKYNTNQMYRIFVEAFADSQPSDYILPTSLNVLCCMACAVFARQHGTLNLLLYKNGGYVERNHQLDALLSKDDETEY